MYTKESSIAKGVTATTEEALVRIRLELVSRGRSNFSSGEHAHLTHCFPSYRSTSHQHNITNTECVEITDQTDHIPISVFESSVRSESSVLSLVSPNLQLSMIPWETSAVSTCVPRSTVWVTEILHWLVVELITRSHYVRLKEDSLLTSLSPVYAY